MDDDPLIAALRRHEWVPVVKMARERIETLTAERNDLEAQVFALSPAPQALAEGAESVVKPLMWTQTPPAGHEHEPFVYWAAGLGGHYRAEPDGLLWMAEDAFVWQQHADQKTARSAAQADYTARILAAIDMPASLRAHGWSPPSQVRAQGERIERLVEALGQIESDADSYRQGYERLGPSYTSPGGEELEPSSYVLAKMDELAEVARAALRSIAGETDNG